MQFTNNIRPFIWAMLVSASFVLVSCNEQEKKLGDLYEGPVEIVNNLNVKYSEAGFLKVLMKTPEQLRYQNDNKIYPDTINIDFYDPTGQIITRLRADSGRYQKSEDIFIVKGNVRVVKSLTNEVLTTTELSWSPRTQKVFTDKPLTVKNEATREITKAVGMDAEQDFSRIKFRKGTGIYRIETP